MLFHIALLMLPLWVLVGFEGGACICYPHSYQVSGVPYKPLVGFVELINLTRLTMTFGTTLDPYVAFMYPYT